MALATAKVEASLRKKGFHENRKKDHKYYSHCWKSNNRLSGIWTRTSHGSKEKDLSKHLASEMAKQIRLTKGEFEQFVSCKMKQVNYEAIVRKKVKQ